MRINWKDSDKSKTLYFEDVEVNQGFRNASALGKGAVYIKVEDHNAYPDDVENVWAMFEVATGMLYTPTRSPVELVDLELSVPTEKPDIY